jgi:hypothetical protein
MQRQNTDLQRKLEKELEKLKAKTGMSYELEVVWLPDGDSRLEGEVVGETIFVYVSDERRAVEVLKHEFIDYAVSQVVEPYKEIGNLLIRYLNEEAYRRKERVVEGLRKLVY